MRLCARALAAVRRALAAALFPMIENDPFRRRRTVFLLLLAEASASITSFALMYLVKGKFGLDQFALYALVRRAGTILTPLMILGTPLALVRHITPERPASDAARLIYTAAIVPAVIGAVLGAATLLDPAIPARILFGGAEYAHLAFPLLTLSASTGLLLIATSGLRAVQRLELSAIGHIVAFSVLPLSALAVSASTASFFYLLAALLLALAVVLILRQYDLRIAFSAPHGLDRAFLGYGLKAAAVEALWMFFLFLPPFVSAQLGSLATSAFHSLALSILTVAASPIAPLATNQLPRIVASFATNLEEPLQREWRRLSRWVVWIALASAPISALTIPLAVRFMFEDTMRPAFSEMLILALSSAAIACYYGLRGIVDVGFSPMHNVKTLLGGVALFGLLLGAGALIASTPTSMHVSLAFTVSMIYVGGLTTIKALAARRRNAQGRS